MFFNKSFRHIDFIKVARIPLLASRQHLVDGSKNHTGNSDNGSFLATTFNKRFIFLFVVRRLVKQEEADLLKAANALFFMHQSYIDAGFTTEQAFELVKIAIGGIKR